jgi:ADP-ribose pyrophosphatase YjhB (NUDIX family)
MVKRTLFSVASRLIFQPVFRQTRGLTIGVRIAVFDDENGVFLVRHGYSPGWLLPGGGVERGETVQAAAARELREEGGIVPLESLILHGIHSNAAQFPGDHIASFVLRRFERRDWSPGLEIVEARFFALDALPHDTTGGTRRRIAEIAQGLPPAENW